MSAGQVPVIMPPQGATKRYNRGFQFVPPQGLKTGSTPPPPFSPGDLPNLELWLDASDLSTIIENSLVPGNVERWEDKSGKGNDAVQLVELDQPFTGLNTINGLNAINFSGSRWMQVAYALGLNSQAVSIYMVMRNTVVGNRGLLSTNYANLSGGWYISQRNTLVWRVEVEDGPGNTSQLINSNDNYVVGDPYSVAYLHDDTLGEMYVDGSVQTATMTENLRYDANHALGIGSIRGDIESLPARMDLAELVITSDKSSTTERDDMFSYLNAKWGL